MILLSMFGVTITVCFIAYVVGILVPYLRHKPAQVGDVAAFQWHVFVPCLNEQAVIGETLNRLRGSLPEAVVWVIDDGSTDSTPTIVTEWARHDPQVNLVRRTLPEAQQGKGAALNAAYQALCDSLGRHVDRSSIIVAVVDADGVLGPGVWDLSAGSTAFGDPRVGAVQIQVRMINRYDKLPWPEAGRLKNGFARLLVRMQDLEFRTTIAAMQFLRVPLRQRRARRQRAVHPPVDAGRHSRRVRDALARRPARGLRTRHSRLALRLEGPLPARGLCRAGGADQLPSVRRAAHPLGAGQHAVLEVHPPDHGLELVHDGRIARGDVLLILPFIQVAGVVIWPLVLGIMIYRAAIYPGGLEAWLVADWGLSLLVVTLGVLPFVLWGPLYRKWCEPTLSRRAAVGLGFANWLYVFYCYYCNAFAFYRLITGQHGWAKTKRNNDPAEAPEASIAESSLRDEAAAAPVVQTV